MYPAGKRGPKFQLSYEQVSTTSHSERPFLVQYSSYKVPLHSMNTRSWIHKSHLSALCCTRRSHTILARKHDTVLQNLHGILQPAAASNSITGNKLMRAQRLKCSAHSLSLLSATHGSSRTAPAFLVLCSLPPASQ